MKKLVLLFAICSLLFAFIGCSCGQNVGPSGLGKVVGVVTDDQTQKPIEGVKVSKVSSNTIAADPKLTDTTGKYEITIPTGTQQLSFTKDGYQSKILECTVQGEAVVTVNVALASIGVNPAVAKIDISPPAYELKVGETMTFEIRAYDSAGTPVTRFVAETKITPAELGTLALNGIFTAKTEGEGTLTVSSGSTSASAYIVVLGNYPSGPPHLIKSWGGIDQTSSIAVGPNTVYVDTHDQLGKVKSILMFDLDGNLKGSIGTNGSGQGQFRAIGGLFASTSALYVGENGNSRVQKLDLNGNFQMMFGSESLAPDFPQGKIFGIYDVTADASGNIYTLEGSGDPREPQRVQKWSPEGAWIMSWGSYGSGQNQFYNCRGITVDNDNNIYVSDSENRRIQKFDSNGNFILEWKTPDLATDVAFSMSDNICYVNSGGKINAYTKKGKLLYSFGPVAGYSLAVDTQANIYFAEYDNNRILKFSY